MRRWFAIFMLALLPLQFSWAAVAAYCGHETGQHAEHLGHHEHRHADQAKADQDSAPADQKAPAGFDFDCGHCHGHCAGMLDFPAGLKAHAVGSAPPRLAEAPSAEHLPAQLERPQWACLA